LSFFSFLCDNLLPQKCVQSQPLKTVILCVNLIDPQIDRTGGIKEEVCELDLDSATIPAATNPKKVPCLAKGKGAPKVGARTGKSKKQSGAKTAPGLLTTPFLASANAGNKSLSGRLNARGNDWQWRFEIGSFHFLEI
jgi:hypothetical protein